jgi:hypothetical protein
MESPDVALMVVKSKFCDAGTFSAIVVGKRGCILAAVILAIVRSVAKTLDGMLGNELFDGIIQNVRIILVLRVPLDFHLRRHYRHLLG